MPNVVQVQYNPYTPRLSILINGMQLSEFSQLVQYSDEDIWQWGPSFLDTLYSELRDDFFLSFIGTEQDAQIMRCLCTKQEHCIGFHAKGFPVPVPLQTRMKELNLYIKSEKITIYDRSIIDAVFLLPTSMQKYVGDISSLDINNLFCSVRVRTVVGRSDYEEKENSIFFLLTDEENIELDSLNQYSFHRPIFVIRVGSEFGIEDVTSTRLLYATTESRLFETIFACFLQMPLLLAFRRCIHSISGAKPPRRLIKISSVEAIVDLSVANSVEVGKSVKITAALDPPGGQLPGLVYKVRNQKIASCDGLCIYGIQEGTTLFEAYKSGEKSPFFTQEISVYKRNRISHIILSNDTLIMGLNDRQSLSCEYVPKDADNVDMVAWQSSNPNVIKVDERGNLMANGLGKSRIICTAENVSAQCLCTVKPYLSSILVDIPLEENALRLEPMDEYKLSVETEPKDCIDDEIIIETSDYNVVNVVNSTLYAKNIGSATVTIRNITGRISQSFQVVVAKKKVSFFQKLFRKQ